MAARLESPADRIGTIGVEAFDAAYGAGFQIDDYDSPRALDCELVEDGGAFEAHRPPEVADRPCLVAFVDGTMRDGGAPDLHRPAGRRQHGAGRELGGRGGARHGRRAGAYIAVGRTVIFTGGRAIHLPGSPRRVALGSARRRGRGNG